MNQVIEADGRGIELRGLADSSAIDELNARERAANPRGFTKGGTLRKVANIDADFLNALCLNMDKDALDFTASGYSDALALRRLLSRWPEMRASEESRR
ncbi:MAG: hypothetical protein LBR71_06670 [Synergistaceae bacterium]|jgi:hypothetical protein|nr:hypothetical protein [Synergistaceae bacterium]